MKGLEQQPCHRYPSAAKLSVHLRSFAHDERLDVSPLSLSQFVAKLFGREPARPELLQQEHHELPAAPAGLAASQGPLRPDVLGGNNGGYAGRHGRGEQGASEAHSRSHAPSEQRSYRHPGSANNRRYFRRGRLAMSLGLWFVAGVLAATYI